MIEESVFRPKPIKGFRRKKVVYFPFDPPPGVIFPLIKGKAIEEKNLGTGVLYLLRDRVVLYQALGAPAAALSLERLIASGAEEIFFLGFCGSLNPAYRIGDVASITKALSDEGTSGHYLPGRKFFSASLRLKKRTEDILRNSGLLFKTGSVVSTDVPFRETRFWLEKMRQKRIDLVDMEASAVFALAEFYGIEAASLMIVSDELFSVKWISRSELRKKIKDYFALFIE